MAASPAARLARLPLRFWLPHHPRHALMNGPCRDCRWRHISDRGLVNNDRDGGYAIGKVAL